MTRGKPINNGKKCIIQKEPFRIERLVPNTFIIYGKKATINSIQNQHLKFMIKMKQKKKLKNIITRYNTEFKQMKSIKINMTTFKLNLLKIHDAILLRSRLCCSTVSKTKVKEKRERKPEEVDPKRQRKWCKLLTFHLKAKSFRFVQVK